MKQFQGIYSSVICLLDDAYMFTINTLMKTFFVSLIFF